MKINIQTKPYRHLVCKAHAGFTLIELLVVIAIIAVLASISYGPIMSFMDRGKITENRNECNSIELAIESFKAEYSYLPSAKTGANYPNIDENVITDDTGITFLNIIMGTEDSSGDPVNEKLIKYYVPKISDGDINGLLEDGTLVDHWANPYTIHLDYDGDGQVDTQELNAALEGIQNADAIIATPGKNLTWGEDDITSWK